MQAFALALFCKLTVQMNVKTFADISLPTLIVKAKALYFN